MPTLDWLNRAEALTLSDKVPYRVLDPVSEHHSPRPLAGEGQGERVASDENLLIQGDNLDALKALLPFYRGRVKCILIDPPYNTRSAFEHYDDNLEYSQWLSMMYPRLVLLRELLHESGSIWVTIDDNEGHYLKVLMDELFNRKNFVANVFWQKTPTRENRTDISTVHDHILLFAKNRDGWKEIRNPLPSSEEQLERFTNPDQYSRGVWASLPAHAKAEKGRREAQYFTITTPSGRKVDPPSGRGWLYTEPRFHEMVQDGRIWFGADGSNVPRVKKFLTEVQEGLVPSTFLAHSEVGTNGQAKLEITQLFPGDVLARRINAQIADMREAAAKIQFQQLVLDGGWKVEPDWTHAFKFELGSYPAPAGSRYDGRWDFKKHYYPVIANLKDKGEEFECARFIDRHAKVKHWVRNLEQEPFGFCLPTSKGRFFPDFIAELEDSRIAVIEYKGAHLRNDPYEIEKRKVGELWAASSGGKCVFRFVYIEDGGLNKERQLDRAFI